MVFSTPAFVSCRKLGRPGLFSLLLLVSTVSCAPRGNDFGIRLDDVRVERSAAGLDIHARQDIELSGDALGALQHGVALQFRIDLSLRSAGSWSDFDRRSLSYEIRYLPLSDHYRLLRSDGLSRTFPRLRHVMAELGDLELHVGSDALPAGKIEVRLRSRLDRSRLPGPMQLPALLSPQWALDSGWVSGSFDLSG